MPSSGRVRLSPLLVALIGHVMFSAIATDTTLLVTRHQRSEAEPLTQATAKEPST